MEYGHTNDGDGLCGHDARLLGRVLWDALWDGRVDQWIENDGESIRESVGSIYALFPEPPKDDWYKTDRQSVENFALFVCGTVADSRFADGGCSSQATVWKRAGGTCPDAA